MSDEGAVQIGNQIQIFMNDGVVTTSNGDAANSLLDNGGVALFDPTFSGDLSFKPNEGIVQTAPDCTADFTLQTQVENSDGNVLASFAWAQSMDVSSLTDLSLTWNFGDGSADVTGSDAMPSHVYTEPGPYDVCLTVSWTFEEEGQEPVMCSVSDCMVVEIEEVDSDCSDELCQIINGTAILGLSGILIDQSNSSPGNLAINTTAVLNFFADFCSDVQASDIVLTCPDGTELDNSGICSTCDGVRSIGIAIGDCSTNISVTMNEEGDCDAGDSSTGWQFIEYDNDRGFSYRLQTLSKEDNVLGLGTNRVRSKMIHKRFINGV